MAEQHLTGYRRPDGSVGVRNHVIILPVDDLSNAVCDHIASTISGTISLPHAYGRLQYGDDLELTFRTLSVATMAKQLERAGFRVESVLGDYRGGAWNERADVWIILAKKG